MSSLVPRVVVTSAWVSPRVKMAEPWVRGRTPTSIQIVADLVEGASIGTALLGDDLLAEDAFAQSFVVSLQLWLRPSSSSSGMLRSNFFFSSLTKA